MSMYQSVSLVRPLQLNMYLRQKVNLVLMFVIASHEMDG